MKNCISCGMPMKEVSDFAMNNPDKDYCVYCATSTGKMQSFEERRQNFIDFMINSKNFSPEVAQALAEQIMKKMPAWKDYFK